MRDTPSRPLTSEGDIAPPRVTVCPSPPPHEALLSFAFTPPAGQINLARQHLERYERWFAGYADVTPVLPSRVSRLNGLTRFLNGRLPVVLTAPDPDKPEPWAEAAVNWLFTPPDGPDAPPAPASCLFGMDDAAAACPQFRPLDVVMIRAGRTTAGDSPMAATVHVRLQQMHGNRPVLGGRVIVHMADGDPRCSASSAYLPIPADRFAHCRLRDEEEAKDLAWRGLIQHAFNATMADAEAHGIYLAALNRWLADNQADDERSEAIRVVTAALADGVRRSARADKATAAAARLEATLASVGQGQTADARHALYELRAELDDKMAVRWDEAQVVPYLPNLPGAADRPDKCFVLPYAGEYYLAYRVEILSAARDRGWRVYVNADADDTRCQLLGRPEPLLAHTITIFRTSEDALRNQPQSVNPQGFYMPGWLASFETAAEGILDQMTPAGATQLAAQFGKRNILAGRGVQALTLAGAAVLVGTDVGSRRSAIAAIRWGPWERFGVGEGVVALAHDVASGKTFAATERGIYAWDAGQSAWREHGTWQTMLTQETPLCLAAIAGMVYVGTARGLYALSAATPAGNWTRWEGDQALQFPVRDVAILRRPGAGGADEDLAYVATLREARRRILAVNEADPEGVQWGDAAGLALQAQMAATTAVTIEGNKAYLGTLWQGIWRQEDLTDNNSWVQIATAGDLNQAAVLTLRVRQTAAGLEALAGTSAGLFRGRPTGADGWTWNEVALADDPSAHETITAVLYLGDRDWLVGTANRGLWRATESNGQLHWTPYGDIGL
ncbi:MAG: hypothetical protein ACP5UQ_11985 [Anaerolineae bacterium]